MTMNAKASLPKHGSERTRLEQIAADAQRPVETVERLYVSELAILDSEARIQAFVPLIAMRRVKDALRDDAQKKSVSTAQS